MSHRAYRYLVTTQIADLPDRLPIVMVDGTVPHWLPRARDQHFDHHKPGGAPIQLLEIPDTANIPANACFVTTQVDADACAAAAWLQLLAIQPAAAVLNRARNHLCAIAYECDHLGQPSTQSDSGLEDFARNAVAALKLSSHALAARLELPNDRNTWSAEQKLQFASRAFQQGTEWLVQAAQGFGAWPGETGEASAYWAQFHRQRPEIWARCRLVNGIGVLDQRGITAYVDPRHLIDWVRQQTGHRNITLTVRDRFLEVVHPDRKVTLPGYSYTLGSVPLHPCGSPKFSECYIWEKLTQAETIKRNLLGFSPSSSGWGGRNEVGGSSWNDAALLTPEEVISHVLTVPSDCNDAFQSEQP
ncbi:hypothetical protein [Nitrosomonas sp. wSCUT-2]